MGSKGNIVAVVGSRNASREMLRSVERFVRNLPSGSVVISGGARGVDRRAASTARNHGIRVIEIRPDYKKYHPKYAPKVRNKEIAARCDCMMAFWNGTSTGTSDAIGHATTMGKPVWVLQDCSSGILRYES